MRRVLSAGAPLPERLAREFTERTGLRVEQGLRPDRGPGRRRHLRWPGAGPDHVGRPLPGVEVRIGDGADPERTRADRRCAARTCSAATGRTAAEGRTPTGGSSTDDIGYFRGPELFLVDRAREVVVVSGFPVYPTEIEQVIRELPRGRRRRRGRHPGSAHAASGSWRSSAARSSAEALVATTAGAGCPAYKRPAEIRLVDDLPRGVTGEVQRAALRRMLERRAAESTRGRSMTGSDATPRAERVLVLTRPGCHLCENADRGGRRRLPRDRRRLDQPGHQPSTPSYSAATATRFRSPSWTASSTTSGGWTPLGCGRRSPGRPDPPLSAVQRRPTLDGLVDGTVTATYRRWTTPRARARIAVHHPRRGGGGAGGHRGRRSSG